MSHWKDDLIYMSESESEFDFEKEFEKYIEDNEDIDIEEIISECENYFPSKDEIQKWAEVSGLSSDTIISCAKRKEKLKLFLPEGKDPRVTDKNNPKYISNYTESKMMKDAGRIFLNKYIISNPKEIISALKEDSLEQIMNKIEKQFRGKVCEAAENYNSWFKICLNIKFLEDSEKGLEMFKRFSSLSKKCKEKECEKLWNSAKPSFGSIGIIISAVYAKKNQRKNLLGNFTK